MQPSVVFKLAGRVGLGLVVVGLFVYLIKKTLWPYALGFTGAGLLLLAAYAYYNRAALKEVLRLRGIRFGANVTAMTIFLLGILVIVNYLSYRHHWRYDVTSSRAYSLSDETLKVLKDLKSDIRITAFFLEGAQGQFKELLDIYTYHSKRISYQFVDPDKNPALTEQYGIAALWKEGIPGVTVVESGKREVKITEGTEQALTNAIIKLVRTGSKIVCALEGHGEKDLYDAQNVTGYDLARKGLEDQNLIVKKVLLATQARVPTECTLLMIAGPKKELIGKEAEAIASYLEGGGSALFMLDPNIKTGYEPLLDKWGIEVGNDIIIEPVLRLFAGPTLGLEPVVRKYGDHPITKGFVNNTLFSLARSISPRKPAPYGITVTTLASTSEESWAETDLSKVFVNGTASFDKNDTKGPISIGVAVTGSLKGGKTSRIVAIGDSDFINNKFITALFNRDFFLNCANWLIEEEELISIRPKERGKSHIFLTPAQADFMYYFVTIILPGAVLLIGIALWWKRRRM